MYVSATALLASPGGLVVLTLVKVHVVYVHTQGGVGGRGGREGRKEGKKEPVREERKKRGGRE